MPVTNDFSASELDLNGNSIGSPTALVWGPDGRLYVTEQDGDIKILTVEFGDKDPTDGDPTNSFYVSDFELNTLVKQVPNHNDDGSDGGSTVRQVTGIDVTQQYDANGDPVFFDGVPAVVMYVTSSDNRIGAGGGGNDANIDTNSGVITRLTQTESGWEAVDIVRGLPRSEENHATNGLEVIQEVDGNGQLISERMIVASGGNANTGAPSNNFAGQQEQPYSAAILEIDLLEIRAIEAADGPKVDDGREYVYDMPTLDDPTRDEPEGDPFGGNDGLNSAKLLADGPVQIYSAGYRNAYDVEVTEDGRVFTYDNGANNNWGGRPAGEDQDGDVDSVEVESGTPPGYISTNLFVEDNEEIDGNFNPQNWDQLHEVTRSDDLNGRSLSAGEGGAQTYLWDHPDLGQLTLVYGGHPNPTRAEGARAGILYSPESGVGNAKLMVSNVGVDDGSGTGTLTSDFLEVVDWLSSIGYSDAFINETVVALDPGVTYSDTFAPGFGGAGPTGRPTTTDVFSLVEDANGPIGLPADIGEIVNAVNPIEGNYLEAGFTDGALDTGKGSVNGLTEYTSTIFDDAGQAQMQGALFAASLNQGQYYIIGRDMDNGGVVETATTTSGNGGAGSTPRTVADDKDFLQSGGAPLGLASIGDDLIPHGGDTAFRGTVWAAIYKQNGPVIEIFQPGDPEDNPLLGVNNYAGQEPSDPTDNDLDGVDDINDPFEFDADNGVDLAAGETYVLNFSQVDLAGIPEFSGTIGDTGLMGAALDGVTPNRDAKTLADGFTDPADLEDGLFDNAGNIIPGGNAPILQIKSVVDGTAVGTANTLRDGLHTGVKLADDVQRLVAEVEIFNWWADQPGGGRISGITFGDGTQSNFLRFVFGDIGGGNLGLEVGLETDDNYVVLGTSADTAFVDALESGGATANQKKVTLQLEISDIGGGYDITANFKVNGETDFTSVPLSPATLPEGVLRQVLDGTYTISDDDTTLPSGAAIGIVAEKDDGVSFTTVDFDVIRIEGIGNEIVANDEAAAEAPGTAGDDTVLYTGPEATIDLDDSVENFDGSGSAADWDLVGTSADNDITVGEGANVVTTGEGVDRVIGTKSSLDGDEVTDFAAGDTVVIEDGSLADATNVIYTAGSAILNVNGTTITFSGPDFESFDPATGPEIFAFAQTDEGLEITRADLEEVVYRVNAGGETITALDDGPDWQSDAGFFNGSGPVNITDTAGSTFTNALTDSEDEIEFAPDVDGTVVPWELFVNERSENTPGGAEMTYNFDVVAGTTYKITLYFTENWNNIFTAPERVFDVAVEGNVPAEFNDIHPLREATDFVDGAGAPLPSFPNGTQDEKQPYLGVAFKKEFTYTATDDVLSLAWQHNALTGVQNPKINAIEITQVGLSAPVEDVTPPVVASIVVEDSLSDQDSPRDVTVTLTDETAFDIATFSGLDGTELDFTGITPAGVSTPLITLSPDQKTATLVYSIDPPSDTNAWPTGTFSVAVAANTFFDAAANDAEAASFDFTFAEPAQPGQVVLAVNAGGVAVDGAAYGLPGVTFEADTAAAPHPTVDVSNTTTGSGNNTNNSGADDVPFDGVPVPDTVFTSERWGNDFQYDVPLANGTYIVDLYFAETFQGLPGSGLAGGVGSRIFDVSIEGETVLDDYDLFDDGDGILGNGAGAPATKIIKSYEAEVVDGVLTIALDTVGGDGADNAKISAFVVRVPEAGVTASITGDATVAEDAGTATYTVTLSEDPTETTNVTIDVTSGSADVPGDAEATGGGTQITLTFEPGGALSQDFTVDISEDTLPELDETFDVTMSGLPVTSGAAGAVTTTIEANDGPVDSVDGVPTIEGDFSDDGLTPTDLGTLATGDTLIVASQQGDSAPGGRERDYFTFTVAEGEVLTGIILQDWVTAEGGTAQAFIGIQAGGQVTTDPVTFDNSGDLLGGYIYNSGDEENPATSNDGNLLTVEALGAGSAQGVQFGDGSGFTPPLPAGQYTIWLNQGGDISTATLRLVTEVPGTSVTIEVTGGESVLENGDFGTTELGFDLAASDNFNGDIEVVYDLLTETGLTQTVSFVDGVGRLTVDVPNDNVDDGDDIISLVQLVSGTDLTSALTVAISDAGDGTASVVTEDDGGTSGPTKGDFIFGINAGAVGQGPVVDTNGNTYDAIVETEWVGNPFAPGAANELDYDGDGDVDNDDELYDSELFGGNTSPNLSFTRSGIDAGEYILTLKFAEIFADEAGARVATFTVNGVEVITDLDIWSQVGQYAALDIDIPVTIEDSGDGTGTLTIVGDPSADNAKISALALYDLVPSTDVVVSVADIEAAEDGGPADIVFTRTGPTDEALTITFALSDGTAIAGTDYTVPASNTVTFGIGETEATVPVDLIDNGEESVSGNLTFDVTITDATVPSGGPVQLGDGDATVTILDDEFVDPADIDGDGILNIDDPFAYDATNGAGRVLSVGGEFTQDFNTDTTDPFDANGGFSGILVNQGFDYPGSSEEDPYGDRTSGAPGVDISGGRLNIVSRELDAFAGGTGDNNTLADGYQSAVDVSALTSFEVVSRASSDQFVSTTANSGGFEQFGVSLGAGGVDDFVKLVISDNNNTNQGGNNIVRVQLAHNGSLEGGEVNYGIGTADGPTVDLSLVGDYEFRLIVDRSAGDNGQVSGVVNFYAAADGALLESFDVPPANIAAGSSLIAAMDGANPLTGGAGGLAYGVFVSEWAGGAANTITANYDFLTIRALDEATLSVAAPVDPVVESGDADTTSVAFTLSAPGFNGLLDIDFTVNGAPLSAAAVEFVDGVATLAVEVANDDLANGDEAVTVVLTGASNGFLTVDATAAETTVAEDDAAPVAVADTAVTVEDQPITFNPALNDTDADTDPSLLTVTSATVVSPIDAGVVLNPDGTVTVTPTSGFVGDIVFDYTVEDPAGNAAQGSATVTVSDAALVSIADAETKVETGDTGFVSLVFPLTVFPATEGEVEVTYTVDGVEVTATVTFDAQGQASLTVDVPNDDEVGADEFTDVALVSIATPGFKVDTSAGASEAAGRVIEDDLVTLDIKVDEDIPVGSAADPYELPEGVETIDTSDSNQPTTLVGNEEDNTFTLGDGPDKVDLQRNGGADTVTGTADALDGTEIANASDDDQVVIVGGENAVIVDVQQGSTEVLIDVDGDTSTTTDQITIIYAEDNLNPTLENGILSITADPLQTFRIQAENFDAATGWDTQGQGAADGDVAFLPFGGTQGEATYNLGGVIPPGTYTVVIGYFDEDDGESPVGLSITSDTGADFSASFVMDDPTGGDAAQAESFRTKAYANVEVGENGVLTLTGTQDKGEFVRIDYIEFLDFGGIIPGNTAPYAPFGIADQAVDELGAFELNIRNLFVDDELEDLTQLTFLVTSALPDGVTFDNGVFGGAPTVPGDYDITVVASDGNLASQPVTFTLAVADINQTPELSAPISDQLIGLNEAVNLDASTAFFDGDGDDLTFSIEGNVPEGIEFDEDTGVFTGAPINAVGSFQVTVTATDPDGESASDTFLFNVSDQQVRDPIRLEAEDATLNSGFFVPQTETDRIRVLIDGSGEATFDLTDVPEGEYQLRIAHWDESDGAGTLSLSLLSGGVETLIESFVLDDDATSSAAADDPSFRVKTLDGTITIADGDEIKLNGVSDLFEYLRVDYIELVPVISNPNFAPSETVDGVGDVDVPGLVEVVGNVADGFQDPDGDALTYALVTGPEWLTVDPATGDLSGTPTEEGDFEVTVSAEDAANNPGVLATSTFTISVEIPANLPPVLDFPIGPISVNQGELLEESVTFTDPEQGTVSYRLGEGAPTWLTIDQFGALSGTPGPDDIGTDIPVTVIATDLDGVEGSVELLVTVENVNDAPTLGTALEDQAAVAGQPFSYVLPADAFVDPDVPFGDTLEYTATLANGDPLPAWLSIDPVTGELTGTPPADVELSVVVTATDDGGLSVAAAPFTIDVDNFAVPTDPVQIEAEDFSGLPTAQNYEVNNLSGASGSQIIRIDGLTQGVVTHDLSEYAGNSYKIAVTFIDETDGTATARVLVDGVELGTWVFDGTNGEQLDPGALEGDFAQPGNYRMLELDTPFGVTDTSVLTVEVQADRGEFGRIDYVTLVPAELPEENEAPTAVTVTPVVPELPEDTDTTAAVKVADILVSDDDLGTNVLSLAGADAASFDIVGTELFLVAGTALDFETKPAFDVTVQVDDAEVGDPLVDAFADFTLAIGDVNEAPVISVTPVITEILEDADTTAATKVADILVSDDALGTFELNLTGDDAALFEIATDGVTGDISLNLIAGALLDLANNPQLDVTVELDDPTIGVEVTEAAIPVVLTVTDGTTTTEDEVVLRINAFGALVAANDGGPDWQADLKDDLGTAPNENNQYLTLESGDAAQDRGDVQGYSGDAGLVPAEVPVDVLNTARSSNAPFSYDIPVGDLGGPGEFEVKLYFAELFGGNQTAGNRIFDIEVEGSSPGELNNYDPSVQSGGGDLQVVSYDVTVNDGTLNIRFAQDAVDGADNPIINAIEIVRKGEVVTGPSDGQALFTANAGATSVLGTSTFGANAMQIENQSANDVSITKVIIDLADTMIPDTGFDTQTEEEGGPIGDSANKPFELDGGTVGLTADNFTVTMGDEIIDPQTGGEGNNQLILDFAPGTFAVGDLLSFSIDIDPFTATSGPIGGAVAGFEIAGGTVTVEFDDGSTATTAITPPDDTLAGRALVKAGQPDLGEPTLTLGDGTTDARVVNQANLPITIDAGVENANGTARVFILDTAFVSNGSSVSADPPATAPNGIQGNNAQKVANVVEVQLDENGVFNGTIPMTRSTTQEASANGNLGVNYFSAGVVDQNGEVTQISDTLVVEYDPSANVPPVGGGGGSAPGDALLRINAFGPEIAVADGPNWLEDTTANPLYFTGPQNRGDTDPTPATPGLTDVPNAIFATARSDDAPFAYNIPVSDLPGIQAGDTVTVNLYFAEASDAVGLQSPTSRIFDVQIEGALAVNDFSPIASFGAGGGGVVSTVVQVVGDTLNIEFLNNNVQNAIVNGIEIIEGGLNPINGGGTVNPPSDPADALEVLGVDDGDFDGIVQGVAVDSTNNGGSNGSVVLTIMDGNNTVDSSNFGDNSLQLTNTGDKEVAAVFIDIRNAVFGDMVFDNDGTGGDTASAIFEIDGDDGTGAFFTGANGVGGSNDDNLFFEGPTPLADTSGEGSSNISGGYRGLLIRFDGSDGGFDGGETVGFSGDGDGNSLAGFSSGLLNPNNVTSNGFDTGGQSGAELVGSTFTVLFADGTTATGHLGSDTTQAGAAGEAVQGRPESTATLSVSTGTGIFASGQVGTYGGEVPVITVSGAPGDVVRVTLHKGFQPTDASAGGSPDLVADVIQARLDENHSDFAVNNAFDVQTVDVTIGAGGTAVVPASAFDYVNTDSGESFAGDDVQPIALTAAVVVPVSDSGAINGSGASDLVPSGPVSQPIYLTNPTQTPVDGSGGGGQPVDGYFEIQGSGNNTFFKIQIEDPNGTGAGTDPDGKWNYLTSADGDGNQSGFQGDGYYLFGSDSSTAIEGATGDRLEYTIFVPEDALGVYNFGFIVSRDGDFAGDQQNDLWLNFKHAEDPGNGDIEEFLTGNGTNEAEPLSNGFIKVFGGPNNGNWGQTGSVDGAPANFGAAINITEAGLYTIQIEGRSQGFHVDYFELYKGSNPGGGASNSAFIEGDPDVGGGGGGGTPGADLVIPIDASSDDYEEFGTSGSSDLEFGLNGGALQYVGLRFDGIDIPDGATITDAYLQFEAFEDSDVASSFTIQIEDTENAVTYGDSNTPADRTYLADDIDWDDVEVWVDGGTYRTPDLTALIQAVIGSDGVSDGAFGFLIEGSGSRAAHAFDGPGAEPELVIIFDDDSIA
ncbi:MAG: malectin domain-containing carbohydrate-binding protein [Pseudomonadota bacterium]